MKLAALPAGFAAIGALLGHANGAPHASAGVRDLNTDYTCAYRITYQLIGYLNTRKTTNAAAYCTSGTTASGYAAGIGSFTTRYGSALAAINKYRTCKQYKGEFDALLPRLNEVTSEQSESLIGLDGFCQAWTSAADNGDHFYSAQVNTIRSMYESPSHKYTDSVKLKLQLSSAVMIATAIGNGLGNDGATLGAIVAATNKLVTSNVHGTSGSTLTIGGYQIDEVEWLKSFLNVRDKLSNNSGNVITNVFRTIIDGGNYLLRDTLSFTGYSDEKISLMCK